MKQVYLCVLAVWFSLSLSAQVHSLDRPDHLLEVQKNPANYAAIAPLAFDLIQEGARLKSVDKATYTTTFTASGAKGIQIYFSELNLTKGSSLKISNEEGSSQTILAKDNPDGGPYATRFFRGEDIRFFLEMDEETSSENQVEIEEYGYAFRDPFPAKVKRDFGTSDTCQVNAHCSEGDMWKDEIRSVVRISVKAGGAAFWCSGVLVNNTNQDCAGYIYSAEHCADGASTSDYEQWVFYFLYESPDCSNPGSEGVLDQKTLTGCSKIAAGGSQGDTDSDFLLLKLTQDVPQFYNPHFAGWNRQDMAIMTGVGIHHPDGDIKKISTFSSMPVSSTFGGTVNNTHWRTIWTSTTNGHGVTEIGSSGSALFKSSGHVLGTLSGGTSACVAGSGTGPDEPDFYGKLWYSWDQVSTDSARQMKPWLDPTASGREEIDGIDWPCLEDPIVSVREEDLVRFKVFPNPSNGMVFIENQLKGSQEIHAYDLQGRLVFSALLKKQLLLELSPGLYIISSADYRQKLIVQ